MSLNRNAKPPVADIRPHVTTLHGISRTDNYAWLRDDKWQEVLENPSVLSRDIRAYLEAENAYTQAVTADLQPLQDALFEELKGRIAEDDDTPPVPEDEWLYYRRNVKGKQYPLFCRRKANGGAEEVYFDVNVAAEGEAFFKIGDLDISPNHKMFAYTVDTKGSERYQLRVVDIASGKLLDDTRDGLAASVVWSEVDGQEILYYLKLNKSQRAHRAYRANLRLPAAADQLLYTEKDKGMFLSLGKSRSKAYITLSIGDRDTTETRLLDAGNASAKFVLFARRKAGERYDVLDMGADGFLIRTNRGGAVNYKLMVAPKGNTNRRAWKTFKRHRENVFIKGVEVFANHIVTLEVENALPRLVITNRRTNRSKSLKFREAAYDIDLGATLPYTGNTVRINYSSPATPNEVIDVNMDDFSKLVLKAQVIPSGHNPRDYVVERVYAPAADGAQVPVTILRHKNTPVDGTAPLWLYGYGAYGISIDAHFSTLRLALVNRGFIFAIAHIRGGSDCGYPWFLNGRLEKKTNTFTDYIAAAEHLIGKGYTTAGNIYAEGRSAGGMLMGAVTNMRPELWKLVHLGVPFVDVLTTMCDETLPLTPPEWPEWGNPLKSEADYRRIAGYCPYSNLVPKAYPNVLITAGLTDPRVTYWEPAKWLAKLRTVNTADTLALMKMEMGAGHGGASGRFDALKDYAFEYAVVLSIFGKA